jgi:hypothetical protein
MGRKRIITSCVLFQLAIASRKLTAVGLYIDYAADALVTLTGGKPQTRAVNLR